MALIGPEIVVRQRHGALRGRLQDILMERAFHPVYQPVVDLVTSEVVGYEALTRFRDGRRPDRWFADATAVGLGMELEIECVREALNGARALPGDSWLSLNVSPALVLERGLIRDLLRGASRSVVLEVTEHVPIEDYGVFRTAVLDLGPELRFAVDDAGAGFASFRHIIELRPDFVKLDIGLVHEIQHDSARQAFVAGMVYFALKSGCALVAEGIETNAEEETLRGLGVDFGQGYLMGRPAPIDGGKLRVPMPHGPPLQPHERRFVGLS
jgi:EAL domain-containing protein (putative c-di-GMP-specific phosphodiesterase class I)